MILCSLASQRAKDILDGSEPKLDYDGKPSVIALKEIAEGLIDMSYFDTRRKQQIEDQLSDAIAEEEAIADITAESQQITQDDSDTMSLIHMSNVRSHTRRNIFSITRKYRRQTSLKILF
jgi:DNA-directed RNA polymerase subunit K/omega